MDLPTFLSGIFLGVITTLIANFLQVPLAKLGVPISKRRKANMEMLERLKTRYDQDVEFAVLHGISTALILIVSIWPLVLGTAFLLSILAIGDYEIVIQTGWNNLPQIHLHKTISVIFGLTMIAMSTILYSKYTPLVTTFLDHVRSINPKPQPIDQSKPDEPTA